jgi:2',3'-cyclic-nucleotide 2'-phosphodiesterase / 3'-nucleotidase / 5'-nucleotidase
MQGDHSMKRSGYILHALLVVVVIALITGGPQSEQFVAEATGGGITPPPIHLVQVWQKRTGDFGEGAAEIAAFDIRTQRLFVINAQSSAVDVLQIRHGKPDGQLDLSDLGQPNSVAARGGLVAVAVQAPDKTDLGNVVFYDAGSLTRVGIVPVGALPDMVIFTPDGTKVLVANEGEPSEDYTIDPVGSVSIIDLSGGVGSASVTTAGFESFNSEKAGLLAAGVRIFGPESTEDEPDDVATVAQDFEPEYIAVSADSSTAYVTLQENNAIAVLDIASTTYTNIGPLGTKDHNQPGNELDASDRDGAIAIRNWPVKGMYLPDAIASYNIGGQTYLVTANEGDTRDWEGFSEEERVGGLDLDDDAFPNEDEITPNSQLGRLKVTSTRGGTEVTEGEETTTVFSELYSFGTRSFSIWTTDDDGNIVQVYDSGADFERITAAALPSDFNSDHETNESFDTRSDDKGPEPEALALGRVGDRTYAFVGLERIGGIMVYNVTDPAAPTFVNYINDRKFHGPVDRANHDLGPESLTFIAADQNPLRVPLLVTANEISSTVSVYKIQQRGNGP